MSKKTNFEILCDVVRNRIFEIENDKAGNMEFVRRGLKAFASDDAAILAIEHLRKKGVIGSRVVNKEQFYYAKNRVRGHEVSDAKPETEADTKSKTARNKTARKRKAKFNDEEASKGAAALAPYTRGLTRGK